MSAFDATLRRESVQAIAGGRAWVMAAAIALLSGLPLLAGDQSRTGVADFAPSFSLAAWCVLISGALLGAASLSGDRRHGTWDLVLAAPGRPAGTVWGKACALAVACGVLVAGFPLQAAVEAWCVSVDWASVASGMAALWIRAEKSTLPQDFIEKMVRDPENVFTTVPQNVMRYAEFMHKVGSVREKPSSWKDMFFPEAHALAGS